MGTGVGAGTGVGVRVGAGALAGADGDDGPAGAAEREARLVVVALPRCVELAGAKAGMVNAPDASEFRAAQLTRPQEEEEPASARGVPPPDSCRARPAPVPQSATTAAAAPAVYRPGPVIQELQPGLGGWSAA